MFTVKIATNCVRHILLLSLLGSSCVGRAIDKKRILDQWEVSNGTFRIRLTEYQRERHLAPHRFDYVFESASSQSDEWRHIMTIRQTDDRKAPSSQARFVNEHTGFVFFGARYAVTGDGGVTWSVWDAADELRGWQRSYLYISEAQILNDGTGKMSLLPFPGKEPATLITKDFGKHWTQD